MKKFTCRYLKDGAPDSKAPNEKIEADSAEEAARLYSERYPSDNLWILVYWGIAGTKTVVNHLTITQRREQEQESLLARQRLESVYQSIQTLESADGTLKDLSYDDLNALVENLRDFPEIRDELSPEECALREKLFMIASFDKSLQALLQTQEAKLQTSLLNQIASGQPTAGAAGSGKSNLARNVGMMGGIAALQKLNQIEENTGDVSEGLGFD